MHRKYLHARVITQRASNASACLGYLAYFVFPSLTRRLKMLRILFFIILILDEQSKNGNEFSNMGRFGESYQCTSERVNSIT